MFRELSNHETCRRLLGPALANQPKVDLQWQSTKLESTRTLINFMKQVLYTTSLDSTLKQSLRTSQDPKDVVVNTQALKEGLDELLAICKAESGPQCPVVDLDEGFKSNLLDHGNTASIELNELVTSDEMNGDKENELPRWVEFLEEVFDKWITLVLHDPSSVTLAENLSFGLL